MNATKKARELVGQKVKVWINGKYVQRVLCEDQDGFYIRFENERTPVKAKLHSSLVEFAALDKKSRAAVERVKESRTVDPQQQQDHSQEKEAVALEKQETPERSDQPTSAHDEKPSFFRYQTSETINELIGVPP
ncbi:hypothetical protein [Bacillus sp. FJAT-52991]|uniref:Uncharacterized protein n=1 Tax=Bacillus kandeliae TaxID=3129297 RepID=A0ABZ2NB61_9BACI